MNGNTAPLSIRLITFLLMLAVGFIIGAKIGIILFGG